jgi:diguanylate cyclase (GGDEF)-like protein
MGHFYFVRHGQTVWNVENKICGATDSPLTELGHEQARKTGQMLREKIDHGEIHIDEILTSPLSRAYDTAMEISHGIDVPVRIEPRLVEQNFGRWEGTARDGAEFARAKENFADGYGGGESMMKTAQRIYNLIDDIRKEPGKTYLLVAHNGISRMIESYFHDMSNEEFAAFGIKNAEVREYKFEDHIADDRTDDHLPEEGNGDPAPSNQLTYAQLKTRLESIRAVFDTVRIVNPVAMRQIIYHADGTTELAKDYCFALWKKHGRCANCISSRTLHTRKRSCKFEFADEEIYFMMANYLEVDGAPCVMEAILHLDDSILIDAEGKNKFVSRITRYNDRMFKDSLTEVSSRRYYDEQVSGLTVQAAAMIDIDYFKEINDNWRHRAGDCALRAAARAITGCVRKSDIVIRYGGDEFLIGFENIPRDVFVRKLEEIRSSVQSVTVPEFPQISLTLSIGGVYGSSMLMDAVDQADAVLYQAKQQRNCVVVEDKR